MEQSRGIAVFLRAVRLASAALALAGWIRVAASRCLW